MVGDDKKTSCDVLVKFFADAFGGFVEAVVFIFTSKILVPPCVFTGVTTTWSIKPQGIGGRVIVFSSYYSISKALF